MKQNKTDQPRIDRFDDSCLNCAVNLEDMTQDEILTEIKRYCVNVSLMKSFPGKSGILKKFDIIIEHFKHRTVSPKNRCLFFNEVKKDYATAKERYKLKHVPSNIPPKRYELPNSIL